MLPMIDRHRALWTLPALALAAAVSLVAAVIAGARAYAHDWYPVECCHSIDCAPVDRVEVVAGALYYASKPPAQQEPIPPSVMIVTTKHGTAVVRDGMPRRLSPDGQMHACIRNGTLICIFMPPAM